MTKLLLPLLLAITTACSQYPWCDDNFIVPTGNRLRKPCTVRHLTGKFDDELQPYLAAFSSDAKEWDVGCYYTTEMRIDTTGFENSNYVIGYCQRPLLVSLRRAYWDIATPTERLVLMYHELGHCALGLEHDEDGPDIMNAAILDGRYAKEHWEGLVDALFLKAKEMQ